MATKLKSVLRNPKSRLVLKAVIFGGLYYLLQLGSFSAIPLGIFVVGSAFLYSAPLFRTAELLRPFLLLLVVALITGWVLRDSTYFFWSAAYFAFLFYLILGVKDLAFIARSIWQRVLNFSLAYLVFALFFYHSQSYWPIKIAAVFIALIFLFRDVARGRAATWLLSLAMLQGLWVISLLPVGFLNAANLAFLTYFVLADLAFHYYNFGGVSRRRILTDVTFFVLLALAVFAFSRWSP